MAWPSKRSQHLPLYTCFHLKWYSIFPWGHGEYRTTSEPHVRNAIFHMGGTLIDVSSNDISSNAWQLMVNLLAATYRELIRVLNANQFYRHQYSDYRADGVEAHHVWAVMWSLRDIRPPMKLETTVKGLKMQFYHNRHIFDITNNVRIGGAGAHRLRNMTPANLVNGVPGRAGHPIIPPLAPGQVLYRPDFTKWSVNASNPQNWRI